MRTTTSFTPIVLLLPLLVLSTALAAQEGAPSGSAASDEAAVQRLRDALFESYGTKNAERGASLFTEEGVLLPPMAASHRGHEEIQQRLEGVFQGQTLEILGMSEETWVQGDRAMDRGFMVVEVTKEGQTEAGSDTGKYILLAVRQGGVWKIQTFMWNLDNPPAPPAPEEEEG